MSGCFCMERERDGKDSNLTTHRLDAELGPAPVTPLVVIPDRAIRFHPEPLRDGLVLLKLDRQGPLGAEGLVGRLLWGVGGTKEKGAARLDDELIGG